MRTRRCDIVKVCGVEIVPPMTLAATGRLLGISHMAVFRTQQKLVRKLERVARRKGIA